MNLKPPTCEGCPAYSVGQGFVPGHGPRDAKAAWIGQGPGETEAALSRPFVGRSGSRLDGWAIRSGWVRALVWVTNTVLCWLPGNRPPTDAEIRECWRRHVHRELASLPHLRLVVPIGVPAQWPWLGDESGGRLAGSIQIATIPDHPDHLPFEEPR